MTPLQALTLGVVESLTEFRPISSSGHLIRVPTLLGSPDQGLAFPVAAPAGGMPYILDALGGLTLASVVSRMRAKAGAALA